MARIDIQTDRPVGTVDERIFGGFIEHLGRCVYGGVFEEGSPRADAQGFRTDVLEAVRNLGLRHVRWPGGNFVVRLPLGRRHRPARSAAPARRAGLARRGDQPVRHRRVHGLVRGSGHRAGALLQHGHRDPGRGARLGRVLQRHRRHVLGQPAAGQRARRAVPGPVLGAGQRDVRRLADRPADPAEVRHAPPPQWANAIKRIDPASRWSAAARAGWTTGTGSSSTAWPHSSTSQRPPVHRLGRLLVQRARARTSPSGPSGSAGALIDRARYAQQISREIGVAYDEWNVWYRTDDGAAGGALHPGRHAGRGDLPQHVRAPERRAADGQPGPAGQRDRAHRHVTGRPVPAEHLSTRCG